MRLDRALVARGLFETRARAQAAIAAGKVRVNGRVVRKAALRVDGDADIRGEAAHPWVGRGALKLAHALDVSGIGVEGALCLDVGASTGGFTEVLLARGAARVVAVDVGREQLHPRLRRDARVTSLEGRDARGLTRADTGRPDVVVCDASFIALHKVLEVPLGLAREGAALVALVKPQFEAGPDAVGRGGVVRDAAARERALSEACAWLASVGWEVEGVTDSPVTGRGGNREYLLWARRL